MDFSYRQTFPAAAHLASARVYVPVARSDSPGTPTYQSAVQTFAYPRCPVLARAGLGDAAGQGEVLQYLDQHAET
jgi:hypothetical protein